MTAPHARQPPVLPRPACTPAAIRAVLAANAGNEVLRQSRSRPVYHPTVTGLWLAIPRAAPR
jgi:hypothetical protein